MEHEFDEAGGSRAVDLGGWMKFESSHANRCSLDGDLILKADFKRLLIAGGEARLRA